MPNRNCNNCGVILTLENSYESSIRKRIYLCKKCQKEKIKNYIKQRYKNDINFRKKRLEEFKKWYEKNRDYMRNYMREYMRHTLRVNGKTVRCNKRQRPDNCEICGYHPKKLYYHHWDDTQPSNGVWVCIVCHPKVELIDTFGSNPIVTRYLKLKSEIIQKNNKV